MEKRILLIECYQKKGESICKYEDALSQAGKRAGLEIRMERRSDDEPSLAAAQGEWDAAVVSGSERMISKGQLNQDFLAVLRSWEKPLLGICYGHQLLAHAFGVRVEPDESYHKGDESVALLERDELFNGFPSTFPMAESHTEVVAEDEALRLQFRLLARGETKRVEAIRHLRLPLWGVQFHPEKSGENGISLFINLFKLLV